jgi:hypothetical protein
VFVLLSTFKLWVISFCRFIHLFAPQINDKPAELERRVGSSLRTEASVITLRTLSSSQLDLIWFLSHSKILLCKASKLRKQAFLRFSLWLHNFETLRLQTMPAVNYSYNEYRPNCQTSQIITHYFLQSVIFLLLNEELVDQKQNCERNAYIWTFLLLKFWRVFSFVRLLFSHTCDKYWFQSMLTINVKKSWESELEIFLNLNKNFDSNQTVYKLKSRYITNN